MYARSDALVLSSLLMFAAACESHPNVDWANSAPTLAAPSAVAGVALEPDHERILVNWNASDPAESVSGYVVYSAAESWTVWSASLPSAMQSTGAACCSFVLDGLPNEQEHWVAVAAVNEVGEGPMGGLPISTTPPGWVGSRQGGTLLDDFTNGVTVGPSGDLFVGGDTYGELDGQATFGGLDGYVVHYRTSGKRVWTRLIGTPADDQALAVAVDEVGNVFVVGLTNGAFPGQTAQGMTDAYVAKFTADGVLGWIRQFGTAGPDSALAVAVYGTSAVVVVGTTAGNLDGESNLGGTDAFVTLYDSVGTRQWTKLNGTGAGETGLAAAFGPSGKIYVAGITAGALQGSNLGGNDAFVSERLSNGGKRGSGSLARQSVTTSVASFRTKRAIVSTLAGVPSVPSEGKR